MEDGSLADAKGKRVDFRNTILILTSNVGADLIKRTNLGFAGRKDEPKTEQEAYDDMRKKVMTEMERIFRPEFRNRLDGVMFFKSLSKAQIKDITEIELKDVLTRLTDKHIKLNITDVAREFLADEGYDPDYGARPLRRVLQRHIEDPLSEGLLAGKYLPNDTLEVDYKDGEVTINVTDRPEPEPEAPEPEAVA
jgi:ATP-dependent Clp protease ATP-binding subunit ClpC